MTKRVAIVGGGYFGFEVAKGLDAFADVTLIERQEAFVHVPSNIRALVDPSINQRNIIPYDKLLKHGTVKRARVVAVDGSGVVLADGQRVDADMVVVATGSRYAVPFKSPDDNASTVVTNIRQTHEKIKAASHVAIVGAGAVGTELAGEIASAMPGKKVTLITNEAKLFPMYPDTFGRKLQEKLVSMGVEVLLGQSVVDLNTTAPYEGSVTLMDGRVIASDLVIPAVGATADTSLVQDLPGVRKGSQGRVKTDPWLRPSTLANVFVGGDMADVGDAMTITSVMRQAPWMVKTLQALLEGKAIESLKPYKPWSRVPLLVPLGPKRGNSVLPLPGPLGVVGDFMTSHLKGRDLFIPKLRKAFNRDV